MIDFVGTSEFPELAEGEVEVLDHVISSTQNLNFADFLNLVYSTYPVDVSEKYSHLDLPAMATAYKSVIESSLSDKLCSLDSDFSRSYVGQQKRELVLIRDAVAGVQYPAYLGFCP